MYFKARTESIELLTLRILNRRMDLSIDELKYYLKLEKGFAGEVQFDSLTEKLQSDCIILNDLKLEVNNTTFQIDSSIIYQYTFYFFEIKNYEGDYFYEKGNFHLNSGKVINNPLDQLKRSKTLLSQLLQNLGYNFPIEAYVVFINPEFTLYQAPRDLPFIFPSQINRFLKKLDMKPSKLNSRHTKLANQLCSLHQNEPLHTKMPPYDYNHLKKGISCKECNSFSMTVRGKNIVCIDCGCEEKIETAVLRNVGEFKLLFPTRKITTNIIHDWCRLVESKKRISRILGKNFQIAGVNKWRYYE